MKYKVQRNTSIYQNNSPVLNKIINHKLILNEIKLCYCVLPSFSSISASNFEFYNLICKKQFEQDVIH